MTKLCGIEGCGRKPCGRGMCTMHYARWQRTGSAIRPGLTRGKFPMLAEHHPQYGAWKCMRQRCYTKTNKAYYGYGARGIKVCDEWKTFAGFIADMGARPEGYSLERIDNNGNYEPSNCRWATHAEQQRNTRYNVWLTFNGETLCQSDWAARLGIHHTAIHYRVKKYGAERALTELMSKPQRKSPSHWNPKSRWASQREAK